MNGEDLNLWPDDKLLALIKKDDLAAFEIIYNKYWSKLYLSAYNILRDKHESEDVVQEILVNLWAKRATLNIMSLNAYLYSSIRYKIFKIIKSGKVMSEFFEEVEKLNIENEAESLMLEKDIARLLDQKVAQLPEKCRKIFILSRKEHLSTKEIAERLGVSPKTVENQITIAIKKLRPIAGELIYCIILTLGVKF